MSSLFELEVNQMSLMAKLFTCLGGSSQLGHTIKLDSVNLEGCNDYTSMYQLWIMEKGREATRRNLLKALHATKHQNILDRYEDYLRKLLVDTI